MKVFGDLGHPMPIYVTRKTAGDQSETGSLSMSIGMAIFAMMLVYLNVIAWSVIGLVTAVRVIV